jgi:uncharacterized protein YycO
MPFFKKNKVLTEEQEEEEEIKLLDDTKENKKVIKKMEKELKKLNKNPEKNIKKIHNLQDNLKKQKRIFGFIPRKKVSSKYKFDKKRNIRVLRKNFFIEIGKLAYEDMTSLEKYEYDGRVKHKVLKRLRSQAKENAINPSDISEVEKEIQLLLENVSIEELIETEKFKYDMIKYIAKRKLNNIIKNYNYEYPDKNKKEEHNDKWLKNEYPKYYKVMLEYEIKDYKGLSLIPKDDKASFILGKEVVVGGKKKKKIRKHRGINQQTGRLKKGFKYSGKKLKSGLPQIVKV